MLSFAVLNVVMLNVVMLNVIILNAIMLNVVMQNVVVQIRRSTVLSYSHKSVVPGACIIKLFTAITY
jgi:hypothetical protein